MDPIPLIILEEHHEAFYTLVAAKKKGWLGDQPYALLHVDEHSDMSLPRLRHPLPRKRDPIETWIRFTYNELDIGNFIWPLVYLGHLDSVTWFRFQHKKAVTPRHLEICTTDDRGLEFMTAGSLDQTAYRNRPDRRSLRYETRSPGESYAPDGPWILSIDEDFIAANPFPKIEDRVIEITEASYHAFLRDPYHFLRISPGSKPSVFVKDKRYFLNFNDLPSSGVTDSLQVLDLSPRYETLNTLLKGIRRPPELIMLCRSLKSGYLPITLFPSIEARLLRDLSHCYPTQLIRVHEIIPDSVKVEYAFYPND